MDGTLWFVVLVAMAIPVAFAIYLGWKQSGSESDRADTPGSDDKPKKD